MIKRYIWVLGLIAILAGNYTLGQDEQICNGDLPYGFSANYVHEVDLSNGNSQLAVAHAAGVYIYDTETLLESVSLYCRVSVYDPIYPVRWSPSDEFLATFNQDSGIGVWDIQNHEILYFLRGQDDEGIFTHDGEHNSSIRIHSMEWSPDGRYIASVGDLPFRVWEVETQEIVFETELVRDGWQEQPSFISWSPDGSQLIFANYAELIVWDTANWEILETIDVDQPRPNHVVGISQFDDYLAIAGSNRYLEVWNTNTWEKEFNTRIPAYVVASLEDSSLLAVSKSSSERLYLDANSQIDILSFPELTTVQSFTGHNANVINLQWFQDGSRLISLDVSGIVYLWDVETGEIIAELVPEAD